MTQFSIRSIMIVMICSAVLAALIAPAAQRLAPEQFRGFASLLGFACLGVMVGVATAINVLAREARAITPSDVVCVARVVRSSVSAWYLYGLIATIGLGMVLWATEPWQGLDFSLRPERLFLSFSTSYALSHYAWWLLGGSLLGRDARSGRVLIFEDGFQVDGEHRAWASCRRVDWRTPSSALLVVHSNQWFELLIPPEARDRVARSLPPTAVRQ